jgi:hypothetical protein
MRAIRCDAGIMAVNAAAPNRVNPVFPSYICIASPQPDLQARFHYARSPRIAPIIMAIGNIQK